MIWTGKPQKILADVLITTKYLEVESYECQIDVDGACYRYLASRPFMPDNIVLNFDYPRAVKIIPVYSTLIYSPNMVI